MNSVIQENILRLKNEIPSGVRLIAVSKTKPASDILQAYRAGQKEFGENYVQELTQKKDELPGDIVWHFIGHLQSNKVKYIAGFVNWIHGVESKKLLLEINKQAAKHNRVVHCLLQIHIAREESKFGFNEMEVLELCQELDLASLNNVRICGLMGMASFTDDQAAIRNEFRQLKNLFDKLKNRFFVNNSAFSEISMGMSSDWKIAVEEGSTIIRVGSAIFGSRNSN